MHLSEIKAKFPKAFEAYVEMLVEDCPDDFTVTPSGNLFVNNVDGKMIMAWHPSQKRVTMDVGSGWEAMPEDDNEMERSLIDP